MPRTRRELGRDAKTQEIVAAAVRRLEEGGYDGLSVVAIARELGVAQNAVYWYFPSKDHLFVAALERMLRDIVARKPESQPSLERKVLWFVEQLQGIEDVRAAMYERARTSEVVAQFADEVNATWRRMLGDILGDRVSDEDRDATVDALTATISGTLLQRLPPAEREAIIAFTLKRLVPE